MNAVTELFQVVESSPSDLQDSVTLFRALPSDPLQAPLIFEDFMSFAVDSSNMVHHEQPTSTKVAPKPQQSSISAVQGVFGPGSFVA